MDTPLFRPLKHALQQFPFVPEIVRDPPHIRPGFQVLCPVQRRRSGAQAQNHIPAAFPARGGDHLDFLLAVRILPGNVITLYKVHTPLGIEPENAVIICPCLRRIAFQTVHIRIPQADGMGIRHLITGGVAVLDGQVQVSRHPWHSPHNMNAEFQAHFVDLIRQQSESPSPGCAGKPVLRGDKPAEAVHPELRKRVIFMAVRVRSRPLDIHNNIFPAILFQVLCHIFGVL